LFSGIECGACNGSGHLPDSGSPDSSVPYASHTAVSEQATRPPTAEEQFAEHLTGFITVLQSSRFLPRYLTQQWIGKIKEINIYLPSKGLVILDQLNAEYLRAIEEYQPQRDIFDLAVARTMEFDSEMRNLKHELNWLEAILKHVEDYLGKIGGTVG
jgi:hypothetical protein